MLASGRKPATRGVGECIDNDELMGTWPRSISTTWPRSAPNALTLPYTQDVSGARSSDKGLLLIPAPAPVGTVPASGGTKPNDPFEESATFRDGVLVDLEPPREFFNVSRTFIMECRWPQASGWKTEGLTSTSCNYVAGKVARGQQQLQQHQQHQQPTAATATTSAINCSNISNISSNCG